MKYFSLKQNLLYNTKVFNSFSFLVMLTLFCAVGGFFKSFLWAVAISNITLLVMIYFRTLKLSEGITISRKLVPFAREQDQVIVKYVISNETGFDYPRLNFVEEFDGVQAGSFKVNSKRKLSSQTSFHVSSIIKLDSGMGIKKFAPLNIIFQDELGLFSFEVTYFQATEVEVHPLIVSTPNLKNAISPDSINYGLYEISKRGDSNLFIGTREYRHGDPVKHINWKLSKKTGTIVVNEYEKNTNAFITILMDLDLNNQLGFGELSTWEAAKDLALSITSNEIKRNNFIQVIANNLYIPFGQGRAQMELIEKHFTLHELSEKKSLNPLIHLQTLPGRGQIYYLCPRLTSQDFTQNLELLMRLKMEGHNVIIFTMDPYEEIKKAFRGGMRAGVLEMDRFVQQEFERYQIKFGSVGIPIINIKVEKSLDLYKQIILKAHNLVEEK